MYRGSTDRNTESVVAATRMPSPPPNSDSRTLSVSNCRRILARPAPRAARRAISFRRAVARDRRRLATFAQAISSTIPTEENKSSSLPRTSPTTSSCSGMAVASAFQSRFIGNGNIPRMVATSEGISLRACAAFAPGRSLPIKGVNSLPQYCSIIEGSRRTGTQNCTLADG